MAINVNVKNVKGILEMNFDVPLNGAYVVTGANGCGKTSLLTVLHRMGARNAFQTGLPSAAKGAAIDGVEDAEITYDIHGKKVSYAYNNSRWTASPRSNSQLIETAFTEVMFFKADSTRVEPTQNELRGVKKYPADAALRAFMNTVFDTKRFDKLIKINLKGRNATAHLVEKPTPSGKAKTYFSEKAFSLGELCVMRLGQRLLGMKNGGLYIIDEFEMALHPAAQIRLFKEIQRIANSNGSTVLVSTHSAGLIKSVPRGTIIYLENNNGIVAIHKNVYPTYALQHLILDEESAPDKLIFVEDISAKHCVEAMLLQHVHRQNAKGVISFPTVLIEVIGGYKEVLRFLERSKSFVPAMTHRYALLDADAEEECIPPSTSNANSSLTVPQQLYLSQKSAVSFLPWTPEVGLCELISSDHKKHLLAIRSACGINNLKISQVEMSAHVGKTGRDLRDTCKQEIDKVVAAIAKPKNWSNERARELLFSYLVAEHTTSHKPQMLQLAGRIFN
ncbi:MAG: ATP-binding protein [Hyphomicrobiales bacterium]|nr:MAG: ATP-binding protein [Hyphomicrobiales bacterium]